MAKLVLVTEVPDDDSCAGCRYCEERDDYWTGQYCGLFDCAVRDSKKLYACRQRVRESKNLLIRRIEPSDEKNEAADISIEGRE